MKPCICANVGFYYSDISNWVMIKGLQLWNHVRGLSSKMSKAFFESDSWFFWQYLYFEKLHC